MKSLLLVLQHSLCSFSKWFVLHVLGGQNKGTGGSLGQCTRQSSAFCASNGARCMSWTVVQMRSDTFQKALWYWKLFEQLGALQISKSGRFSFLKQSAISWLFLKGGITPFSSEVVLARWSSTFTLCLFFGGREFGRKEQKRGKSWQGFRKELKEGGGCIFGNRWGWKQQRGGRQEQNWELVRQNA